jgi:hypothetical protein
VGAQVSAAKWRRRREGLGDSTVRWRGGPAGGNSRKLVASGRAGDQHTWGGGGPVQAWATPTGLVRVWVAVGGCGPVALGWPKR